MHLVLLVEGFPKHLEEFIKDFKSRKFGEDKSQHPTVREIRLYNVVTRKQNMPYVISALKKSPNYGYGFRKYFDKIVSIVTKMLRLKQPKDEHKEVEGFKFRGVHFQIIGILDDPKSKGTEAHPKGQELT